MPNELLPEDPGYEYGTGLLPVRRKIVPYAPGKGPLELAWPGAIRGPVNDLTYGLSALSDIVSGKTLTAGELEQGGLGLGYSMAMAGAGVPAESGAFGSFAAKPKTSYGPYAKFWDTYAAVGGKLKDDYGLSIAIAPDTEAVHNEMKFVLTDTATGKKLGPADIQGESKVEDLIWELQSAKAKLPPLDMLATSEFEQVPWEPDDTIGSGYSDKDLVQTGEDKFGLSYSLTTPAGKYRMSVQTDEFGNPIQTHMYGPGMEAVSSHSSLDEAVDAANYAAKEFAKTAKKPLAVPGYPKQKPWMEEALGKSGNYGFGKSGVAPLERHPIAAMRDYTPKELDWEYETEYGKYAKDKFPDAFKSREDFQQKYDRAPLRHLSTKELENLDYGTVGPVIRARPGVDKMQIVKDIIGTRRDVPAITEAIQSGKTTPPIVIRHENGMRLLAGNTRLMTGAALGKSIPVKVIDIRQFPLRHTDPFDPSEPLPVTAAERQANFDRWFAGSKAVDASGKPMVLYHASRHHTIEAFDPEKIKQHSAGSRDFISLTTDPKFASNWQEGSDQGTIYPVHVSAKNPGDFRDPESVKKALDWYENDDFKVYKKYGYSDKDARARALSERSYKEGIAKRGEWQFWEKPKMWRDLGWDGAFMTEYGSPKDPINLAVPRPEQIKSVFNKGHYSSKDPRILYSGGTGASGIAGALLGLEPVEHDPFADSEPVDYDPFKGVK